MTTHAEFEQRRHEVADYILEHREEFDMSTFGTKTACGTVACLAGTAALLASEQGLVTLEWLRYDEGKTSELAGVTLPDGTDARLDVWAAFDYLGLTSTALFFDDLIDDPELAAKALLDAPYSGKS